MKNQRQKPKVEYLDQYRRYLDGEEGVDILPERIREALKTLSEVARILLDESHPDETIREAIFSKVPREKIEEAVSILKEWQAELDLIDFD